MLGKIAVVCSVAATSILVVAAPAHAACMSVVVDTKLTSGISCPGNTAISIDADNVTLNLNGFTVDGDDTPGTYGVLIDGRTGVTVKNGTIQDFSSAVRLQSAATVNTLKKLTLLSSLHGFHLDAATSNVITRNLVTGGAGAGGVVLTNASNANTVSKNDFIDLPSGSGVRVNASNGNIIEKNKSIDNERGIYLLNGAQDNIIEKNQLELNLVGGIVLNDAVLNDFTKNRIRDNIGGGILLNDSVIGSDGNDFIKNNVSGTTAGDGGFVAPLSNGNLFDKNKFNENSGDGLEVAGTGNPISNNIANENGELGFEIGPLNGDGGGNKAKNNGDPAQCSGLVCNA